MKSDFSFPRSLKLLTAGDYKYVFEGADVRVSDKHMLILARSNQLPHPRVGLVIAKKHVKLATDRNRIKRNIRESFRLERSNLPGFDIVVLARPGLGSLDNKQLQQRLHNNWLSLVKKAQSGVKNKPFKRKSKATGGSQPE